MLDATFSPRFAGLHLLLERQRGSQVDLDEAKVFPKEGADPRMPCAILVLLSVHIKRHLITCLAV
jgi:hypothetical protein